MSSDERFCVIVGDTAVVDLVIEEHNRAEVKQIVNDLIDLIYDGEYSEGEYEHDRDSESEVARP